VEKILTRELRPNFLGFFNVVWGSGAPGTIGSRDVEVERDRGTFRRPAYRFVIIFWEALGGPLGAF
jgi:hypothetical protein